MLDIRIIAAVCALMFASGWTVRGWKESEAALEIAQKTQQKAFANAAIISKLQGERNASKNHIDALTSDLRGLRLRLPKGCAQPRPTSGGGDATTGDGDVPNEAQDALDRFTRGVAEIARDADEMVEQCRVVSKWASGVQ